jgi:hypothetical protein
MLTPPIKLPAGPLRHAPLPHDRTDMRTTSRGLIAALVLPPLLAGCFAPSDSGDGTGAGAGSGGRLRVALAVPPVQALSPYSNDATVLSKLSVAEGLTGARPSPSPAC